MICASGKRPDLPDAIARFETNGYTVFENPTYMDRVTFVHYLAGSFANQEQLLSRLSRKYDFRQSALVRNGTWIACDHLLRRYRTNHRQLPTN